LDLLTTQLNAHIHTLLPFKDKEKKSPRQCSSVFVFQDIFSSTVETLFESPDISLLNPNLSHHEKLIFFKAN